VLVTDSPVLHYEPDKGAAYGQAFKVRGVRRAWESVQRFLGEVTIADPPSSISLAAYRATEWDDATKADAGIAAVRERFGAPTADDDMSIRKWPSGEPLPGGRSVWELTAASVADALDFVASGEPWWKQTLGPVELRVTYSFRWRIHDAPAVPSSELGLCFGRRSSVQPLLWFPFAPHTLAHAAFERDVVPSLPFALLPRHLRVAEPRRGGGYSFHRIGVSDTTR
jgi:hypothetical protein